MAWEIALAGAAVVEKSAITFDGDTRVKAQLPSSRGAPPREVTICW